MNDKHTVECRHCGQAFDATTLAGALKKLGKHARKP